MKNKQASFPATPANNYYFYLKKPAVSTIWSEHLVSLQLWATTWSQSFDFQSKTSSKLSLELKSPIIDKVEVHGQETCLVKWQSSPNTLQCPTAPRQLRVLAHNLVIVGMLGPLLEGAPARTHGETDPFLPHQTSQSENPAQAHPTAAQLLLPGQGREGKLLAKRKARDGGTRAFNSCLISCRLVCSLHVNVFRTTILLLLVKIKKTKIDLHLLIWWQVNSFINFVEQGYIYSKTAARTLTMIRKEKTTIH